MRPSVRRLQAAVLPAQVAQTKRRGWRNGAIAAFSIAAIALHLILRFGLQAGVRVYQIPLTATLVLGGIPLIYDLLKKLIKRDLGSDLLAGISIVTAVWLKEYLAGAIIVLMLSGGAALENYAVQNASSVLRALAKRMPSVAHRKRGLEMNDVALADIALGDTLVVFPHEICPVDGVVMEGHGVMDESYLTGEPFKLSKAPGSAVLSGAINGDSALTMTATKLAVDSRCAKITEVMRTAEQNRPQLRRLGDRLGASYAPLSLALAFIAWAISAEARRFLAVLVVATPCPLLIAIPVAIIGSVSLSARRGIIVKNPIALEQMDTCETVIFDKTGTLTYGTPKLSEVLCTPHFVREDLLGLVASLERYSRHPLALAVLGAAREENLVLHEAAEVSEKPGEGLRGIVLGRKVQITGRNKLGSQQLRGTDELPPTAGGLECIVLVDGAYAATFRFRDEPRAEGFPFIRHLGPRHHLNRILVVSGDRESEVRYLAQRVGIREVYAEKSPEEKLAIVREEALKAKTLFVGDGINDAPALMAATVGVAVGKNSDITSEAAGVVILDNSLKKVDELMHIGRRMRAIALQSAVGGMSLSMGGMILAAAGHLTPVAGAVYQEVVDLLAVANALRAALVPKELSDF